MMGVNQVVMWNFMCNWLLSDGVTVVLYNVMQTYNRMDTIEADQVGFLSLRSLGTCKVGNSVMNCSCFPCQLRSTLNENYAP